ncbi:hypothetical protein [Acidisoma sp. 7E03]
MAVADLCSFSYTGKIVSWTVPATGAYQILAYGGQGGKGGGLGAEIGGTFTLQAGQALTILVGNEADPADLVRRYAFAGGGGGGGTFVIGAQTTPLIVAGGGGNTGAAYSQNGLIFSQSPRRYQDGAAGTAGNRGGAELEVFEAPAHLGRAALRSGRSFKSAADTVGFGSAAAFSRAFSRKFGYSPVQDKGQAGSTVSTA